MTDLELKDQLLLTCPVQPGQEGRAWHALRERLEAPAPSWLSRRTPRLLASGALALLVALAIFNLGVTMRPMGHGLAFADSQVPGIYATSFYSHSAQAQVVWLNGMDPASDRLTYLDPTTVVRASSAGPAAPAAQKSDRL